MARALAIHGDDQDVSGAEVVLCRSWHASSVQQLAFSALEPYHLTLVYTHSTAPARIHSKYFLSVPRTTESGLINYTVRGSMMIATTKYNRGVVGAM